MADSYMVDHVEVTLTLSTQIPSYMIPRMVLSSGMTPCRPAEVHWHFGGMYCLQLQGQRVSKPRNKHTVLLVACLAYSSALKMETLCSSETTVELPLDDMGPHPRIQHSSQSPLQEPHIRHNENYK
jgi:hypothetical protein